nr:hypothetical protein Iba_chr01aCG7280 [Ipomoea batatas]GME10048.1 hypothetical protein Iba_scaffold9387CG0020 [Ipomoea batatas]GME10049.1 hypothetical protein Iba_scaffold9388CG0010 [Ipomoea batatas]
MNDQSMEILDSIDYCDFHPGDLNPYLSHIPPLPSEIVSNFSYTKPSISAPPLRSFGPPRLRPLSTPLTYSELNPVSKRDYTELPLTYVKSTHPYLDLDDLVITRALAGLGYP